MAFRVGQKVVCVDDSPSANWTDVKDLVLKRVYVIEGFDDEDPSGEVGIYLVGVPKRYHPNWQAAVGWRMDRFRPVANRKTDISAFKLLLVPGAKIREDA